MLAACRHRRQHPLTNRLPARLSVPPLTRRQITAWRRPRSAVLFVGSTPATFMKVQKPGSTFRNSEQVPSVRPQPHSSLDFPTDGGCRVKGLSGPLVLDR